MVRGRTLSYCADQVRRLDPDRYLCALFAPAERREALFALYAFNAEIARVRESVSQPMLGLIRLQWWRDAIAGIYDGAPPRHEVVAALAEAVAGGLARVAFDRLIDARERDLDDAPPETLAALEEYADGTSAALIELALEALGVADASARRAGRHVGIAWALSGHLRAVAYHARARRLYLPADLMAARGVGADDVFAMRRAGGLDAVVAQVAEAAGNHLRAARALRGEVPRGALSALLPASLADSDLRRLRRARYDVFDSRLAAPGVGRKLRLAARAAFGRY